MRPAARSYTCKKIGAPSFAGVLRQGRRGVSVSTAGRVEEVNCSASFSLILHIRRLLNRSHHVDVQQLHHLGLAVSLEVSTGKWLKGPSSAVGDPAAAIHARQLASNVDFKVRIKEGSIEA